MTTATATTPFHTIALLVRNKPGVLVRTALVFSRRGYNIESLRPSMPRSPATSRRSTSSRA